MEKILLITLQVHHGRGCHFSPYAFRKNGLVECGQWHGHHGMRKFISQFRHGNHVAVFFIYGNHSGMRLEFRGSWAKRHGELCGDCYIRKIICQFFSDRYMLCNLLTTSATTTFTTLHHRINIVC